MQKETLSPRTRGPRPSRTAAFQAVCPRLDLRVSPNRTGLQVSDVAPRSLARHLAVVTLYLHHHISAPLKLVRHSLEVTVRPAPEGAPRSEQQTQMALRCTSQAEKYELRGLRGTIRLPHFCGTPELKNRNRRKESANLAPDQTTAARTANRATAPEYNARLLFPIHNR